jgi:hypothetical protein
MARPIYPHELSDPDFQWLVSTYKENNSVSFTIEASCLPVILITGPQPTVLETETKVEQPKQIPIMDGAVPHLKDETEYS